MLAHENDKGIWFLPVGYAALAFGLLAFTFGTLGPALGVDPLRGVYAAVSLAGVIFIVLYHRIASAIMERWQAGNRYAMARYEYEAGSLGMVAAGTPSAGTGEDDDGGRIEVHTADGDYSLPRLSEAERRENAIIGDCLQFIAIGIRSKSFSLRAMLPNRQVGWSEMRFEQWWKARSDQLVAWGLFEKAERSGTRPAPGHTPESVRRALLHREFTKSAVGAGQTGQGQTA